MAVEGIPFQGFYGFHIHEQGICIPTEGYSGFPEVGLHYNPNDLPHLNISSSTFKNLLLYNNSLPRQSYFPKQRIHTALNT